VTEQNHAPDESNIVQVTSPTHQQQGRGLLEPTLRNIVPRCIRRACDELVDAFVLVDTPSHARRTRQCIRWVRCDIVHCHQQHRGFVCYSAAWRRMTLSLCNAGLRVSHMSSTQLPTSQHNFSPTATIRSCLAVANNSSRHATPSYKAATLVRTTPGEGHFATSMHRQHIRAAGPNTNA
jgi:hypothetical protein